MLITIMRIRICRLLNVLSLLVPGVMLISCGQHEADTSVVKVDACSLVSAPMAKRLSPNLGAGHESSVPHLKNVSNCVWDDPKTHMPKLMLTVSPASKSGSVKDDLTNGMGNMGYKIVSVSGLGDEAFAAIQKADPAHGLSEGLATLEVRSGHYLLGFSPMTLPITGPGTASFSKFKRLAAEAIENLKGGKNK